MLATAILTATLFGVQPAAATTTDCVPTLVHPTITDVCWGVVEPSWCVHGTDSLASSPPPNIIYDFAGDCDAVTAGGCDQMNLRLLVGTTPIGPVDAVVRVDWSHIQCTGDVVAQDDVCISITEAFTSTALARCDTTAGIQCTIHGLLTGQDPRPLPEACGAITDPCVMFSLTPPLSIVFAIFCSVFNGDSDGDGVPDAGDNCPATPNPTQDDGNGVGDACAPTQDDQDLDGVPDGSDNCPTTPNPGQEDLDQDGAGDACDVSYNMSDIDGDGHANLVDNCPIVHNPAQDPSEACVP